MKSIHHSDFLVLIFRIRFFSFEFSRFFILNTFLFFKNQKNSQDFQEEALPEEQLFPTSHLSNGVLTNSFE